MSDPSSSFSLHFSPLFYIFSVHHVLLMPVLSCCYYFLLLLFLSFSLVSRFILGVGDCGTDSHVRFFSLFKLFTISLTVSTAMSSMSLSCSIISTIYFLYYSLSLANFPT
ncbi:hypothetical protein BJ165DRAFT_1513599, partial [Panaeolus papilionaceus]